jgi:hypothetical protein
MDKSEALLKYKGIEAKIENTNHNKTVNKNPSLILRSWYSLE